MVNLETKIPPPIIMLSVGTLMWLGSQTTAPIAIPHYLRLAVVLILVCGGLCMGLAGIITFKRAKTTLNPLQPITTSSLVVSGIFRFTRNPMYLGLLLILLAWATFLSNALAFLIAPLFIVYMNRFQILPEERALTSKFGTEFTAYKNKVRRWL